jgi:chemotaxis protein methyltransferase CheR
MMDFFKKKKKTSEQEETVQEPVAEEFEDILPVADYFKNETGVTFERQTAILKNKTISFCRLRHIHSFSLLLERITRDPVLKQELIDYLTTNESYFYREFKQIAALVELIRKKNERVTILCAPSATGEEAYSIAIALLEAGIPSERFHITGIDINADAVARAKEAWYRERNTSNLSESIKTRYFEPEEDRYRLKASVKRCVTFKRINIFDEAFTQLGRFDYVFSRNMLIYFDKETKLRAKAILEARRKSDEHPVFFGHADLF